VEVEEVDFGGEAEGERPQYVGAVGADRGGVDALLVLRGAELRRCLKIPACDAEDEDVVGEGDVAEEHIGTADHAARARAAGQV
jgi:hypothetical protein